MKKLLILAIILRLLLGSFYLHPDIKTFNYQASFLKEGVFNIYTYLAQNKKQLPLKDDFVYFPLTYFTLGAYQAAVSPILGKGFDAWLSDASVAYAQNPHVYWYLLILKIPYLVLDIAIVFVLMKFFDNQKDSKKAATIWLFNPFSIIFIYVFTNVDIFAIFFVLLSLLFAKREKLILAAVFLGIASSFKLFPLLFLPFLFLVGRTIKEKLLTVIIPLAIVLVTILPFISFAFVQSALVSGLTTRIFSPNFSLGFGEAIIFGMTGMVILFLYAHYFEKSLNLTNYWIFLFLIFFSFAHFHIQWLLWLAPFLAILSVEKPKLTFLILAVSVLAVFIPFLYEDRSMTVALLRGYSLLFDLAPTPFTIIQKAYYDPYGLQSIFHSALAGSSLILITKIFKEGSS